MKHDTWLQCESCDAEYQVISAVTNSDTPDYCPFCGTQREYTDEEADEDY